MALRIFTGNYLEVLAEELAGTLARPLSSPMVPEIIVVQSRGMERWISMELARYHGVWANCRFPFPNSFVDEMFDIVVPADKGRDLFDPSVMTWRIMQILPTRCEMPGFESIKAYLDNPRGKLKALQLARQIADTFDQYLIFRPDMIFTWEAGEEDHWQVVLWRDLAGEHGLAHRAARGKAFLDAIDAKSVRRDALPERVSVFGISTLPRFHMEIIAAIARFTEVNLFLMNPCGEYWGDIASDGEIHRRKKRYRGETPLRDEDLYLERGNSLLSSMGTHGRDFFDLINEFDSEEAERYEDPGEENLLASIQSDILTLRDRPGEGNGKTEISAGDRSIQIHSCHSHLREIEVLRDHLLHLFENDPGLTPRDILVMAPDIEQYASYIEAVFDSSSGDGVKIPFSIADRTVGREGEICDTFMKIIGLAGSRCGATEVLDILESPSIRRRFGFDEEEVEHVHRWVKDGGIRWGIDEESRRRAGLHPFRENTWRAGLDRLLVGYALPGHNERLFEGILPYDNIEGGEADLLGRFVEWTERLFAYIERLEQSRQLVGWAEILSGLLDDFFIPDDVGEREIQLLRQAFDGLSKIQELLDYDEEIDGAAVRWHLQQSLEQKGFGFGFMTGRVTFCALLPMRSIPFRVICLIGMNGDAYPRQSVRPGFDYIAQYPRRGDRSRRNDDRYLFLETMLSARRTLYISYVGQSIRDNTAIQPSVLVSELLDYIDEGFEVTGGDIRERLVMHHRLQAFNPEYFREEGGKGYEGDRLFSYSEQACAAARRLVGERRDPASFISSGLPEPGEEELTVSVCDLCRFYSNPARYLLNHRLEVFCDDGPEAIEEREIFEVSGLQRYLIGEDALRRKMDGQDLTELYSIVNAAGQLPHGAVGETLFEDFRHDVERFAEYTAPYREGPKLDPLEVDLDIAGIRLVGRIEAIYQDRMLRYRYGQLRPEDYLTLWIQHIIVNIIAPGDYPRTSMAAGLQKDRKSWMSVTFNPVENGEEILTGLLGHYRAGLVRPLAFFPRSSWTYVEYVLEKGKEREDAVARARTEWMGSEFSRGEGEDLYYRQCFQYVDPFDDEFCRVAEDILEPVLTCRDEVNL
ncbi:MAG TPA: exodeoxyribonuclease V subunit gamma [Deltaproteobacteria bacterium]|nr:exodeoxyribonuclease V subunit gamma [Deltaproteobacteria bacterium]